MIRTNSVAKCPVLVGRAGWPLRKLRALLWEDEPHLPTAHVKQLYTRRLSWKKKTFFCYDKDGKDLVELLFVQPYCRIDNVMEQLGVSRPTASRYLNELSEAGLLTTRQVWKETLFINEALLQVLKE